MDKQTTELLEQRAELKHFITQGMDKTFPARLFNVVGIALQRVFRLAKRPHWSISATLLFVLGVLPGSMIALGRGEFTQWRMEHVLYFGLQPYAYLSSIVSHINVTYNLLPGIRDHVVDSVLSMEDLEKLKKWLSHLFAFRRWLIFSLFFGFLIAFFFALGLRVVVGDFITGLILITFFTGPFLIAPLHVIVHMLRFPPLLTEFHLDLYHSDPANSEVIQHLIYILNVYLYFVAGYIAIGTLLSSLQSATVWFAWVSILIAWIPIILQFLINQYAIRKIIISAKWKVLRPLQGQIKQLQNQNLMDAPEAAVARIRQLMEMHDSISSKPNSILTWGTGLSLFNQLMLPLLGLFLGKLEEIVSLLGDTP